MTAGGATLEEALAFLPKSKLRYNAQALDPPLVAARFGYKFFGEWDQLTPDEQAFLIAAYRAEKGMQAYQAHERK